MKFRNTPFLFVILLASAQLACYGDIGINKDVVLEDGETTRGGMSSVNGSIYIGDDCIVRGDCNSVNGKIKVGKEAKVEDLNTVNGSIKVGRGVEVRGDACSVNGSIYIAAGSEVDGEVSTVNGSIELDNTTVSRDISTYNGDIELLRKSVVGGNILIKESHGSSNRQGRVTIVIRDGSVVKGNIIVEDEDRRVTVRIDGDSKVEGRIEGAEVIRS